MKAAELIETEFRNMGYLNVSKEDTEYIKSEKYIFLLYCIGIVFSLVFVITSRFFNTLLLAFFILFYFGFFAKVYPKIELKFAKSKSTNVIATLNPEKKRRIILCAHYDSPKVMGKYLQKMLKPLRRIMPLFGIVQICFITVLFAHGTYHIVATHTFELWTGMNYSFWLYLWWFFMFFALVRVSVTIFIALQQITKKYALGADDNASGIAVILEVAKRLIAQKKLPDFRIDFACFAAEERGLFGSRKWVNRHLNELDRKNTFVFNLDCVGRGKKFVLIKGLGLIFKKYSDPKLYHILKKSCIELNYPYIEDWGSGSDHYEFLEKKLKCVAVLRGDTEKANIGHKFLTAFFRLPIPRKEIPVFDWIHTEDDVHSKINKNYLDETVNLVMRFIDAL